MKKNFLVLALVILSFGAYSQKIEIQNASNYSRNKEIDKAVDCIERATTNEETKMTARLGTSRGRFCSSSTICIPWLRLPGKV